MCVKVSTESVPRAIVHINLPLTTLGDTNEFISGLGSGEGKCHTINDGVEWLVFMKDAAGTGWVGEVGG